MLGGALVVLHRETHPVSVGVRGQFRFRIQICFVHIRQKTVHNKISFLKRVNLNSSMYVLKCMEED